ncbi:CHAT domain-containing protein [Halorussus litoreus]|uniref:hypothetical protein n=1 Tax=Halorussus litoreus TaxID=1710536 RepID=UPI000E23AE71|nr:hypothetical protein [Halorussus litoreus]
MAPRFDTLDDTTGLAVVDPIETRRFTASTPTALDPSPADPESFRFPVSSACTVEARALDLPYPVLMYVWRRGGEMLTDLTSESSAELPPDEYLLELNTPVKIYVQIEAGVSVESDVDSMRIEFDRPAEIVVGARSFHDSPETTVTTTDEPEDVMAAVSTFGSVLKTTTPERSWPTLRGHPPRVERGDELSIPDDLDAPETGITVEVPPNLESIYPVAPLAYYFGATVVPGERPRLTVGGFERRFDAGEGFEEEVVRTVKQAFLLDCVVRTEGYYPIEMADRNRVESRVDLDFAALYDAPFDEQLEAYFSVPYSTLADAMPTWHRVTFVRPTPRNVEALPYLVNDFSILRTPPRPSYEPTETKRRTRTALDDFKRAPPEGEVGDSHGADSPATKTRTATTRRGVPPVEDYVQTPDVDALEQAWVGEGTPVRGTKVLPEAFENDGAATSRGEDSATEDGVVDITVVCNDEAMREEWDAVAEVYGPREAISFDPSVHFDVTTDELRDVLQTPTDIFHYVGHIDGRGFECADGVLDARELDEVRMQTFLLNACRSYGQGVALVEAGSNGGIVSLGNVGNPAAVELGETMAKLFQGGFSVGSALAVTREATFVGSRYVAVGDPGFTVTGSGDVIPLLYVVDDTTDGELTLTLRGYPTRDHPIGSLSLSWIDDGPYFLSTGQCQAETTNEELVDLSSEMTYTPIIVDDELTLIQEWPGSD